MWHESKQWKKIMAWSGLDLILILWIFDWLQGVNLSLPGPLELARSMPPSHTNSHPDAPRLSSLCQSLTSESSVGPMHIQQVWETSALQMRCELKFSKVWNGLYLSWCGHDLSLGFTQRQFYDSFPVKSKPKQSFSHWQNTWKASISRYIDFEWLQHRHLEKNSQQTSEKSKSKIKKRLLSDRTEVILTDTIRCLLVFDRSETLFEVCDQSHMPSDKDFVLFPRFQSWLRARSTA